MKDVKVPGLGCKRCLPSSAFTTGPTRSASDA